MSVTHGKVNKEGVKPYYYNCSMKINSGSTLCNTKNLNGRMVDQKIIEDVLGYDVSKVIEELERLIDSKTNNESNTSLEGIVEQIEKLKIKKSNIFGQLTTLDLEIDKEMILEYQKILREINNEITNLETKMKDVIQYTHI